MSNQHTHRDGRNDADDDERYGKKPTDAKGQISKSSGKSTPADAKSTHKPVHG
jgi:hypothetical protein